MGNEASKNKKNMVTDLGSYDESISKHYSDLKSFDAKLQSHLNQVMKNIADGAKVPSLSLDSLKPAIGCFVCMNQAAVRLILDHMEDILNENDLSELVKEYFDNSLNTLRFFNALEKCLLSARDNALPVLAALRQFDKETEKAGNSQQIATRLEKALNDFKAAGDPFTEEFFQKYLSVYNQQKDMLEKFEVRKEQLAEMLKRNGIWRNVSRVKFGVTVASVAICTVIAAFFSPPVAVALGTATFSLFGMGHWIDSSFGNYENSLKGQHGGMISSAHHGADVAIKELESIRVLFDALEINMKSLMRNDAVKVAIEDTEKLLDSVKDLRSHADTCRVEIARSSNVVREKITMLSGSKFYA